eukprot:jgi/Mesen1/7859/ME000042S07303
MTSVRVTKSPGGDMSHNVFSWADGTSKETNGHPSAPRDGSPATRSQIFGGDDGEQEPARKRPGHDVKQRDLSGSGIFDVAPANVSSNAYANNNDQNSGNFITDRPSPAGGKSQISFGNDEPPPPPQKKLVSPLKALELHGTTETLADVQSRKAVSEKKIKDLEGSFSIFTPPGGAASSPSSTAAAGVASSSSFSTLANHATHRGAHTAGGRSQIVFGETPVDPPRRRVSDQKVLDLVGRGSEQQGAAPHGTPAVSEAKQREMQGCNIFVDEKPFVRDSLGGVRKPPGGESSLTLV